MRVDSVLQIAGDLALFEGPGLVPLCSKANESQSLGIHGPMEQLR